MTSSATEPAPIPEYTDNPMAKLPRHDLFRVTVDGMSVHYAVWGKSRPVLVLLHGGSGSWTHWYRNIEALSSHYTLVVPDLPGTGDSDLPRVAFDRHDLVESMGNLAADVHVTLQALLEVLGHTHYRLAGFSMGSIVAGVLAARFPEGPSQLALVGTSALGLETGGPVSNVEPLSKSDTRAQALARQGRNLGRIMLADPSSIDSVARQLQYDNVTRARIRTHWLAKSDVLALSLPHVTVPTDIIWGTRDVYAPDLDERERVVNALRSGVNVHRIKGAGHWVMYECADEFNRVLLEVLSRAE